MREFRINFGICNRLYNNILPSLYFIYFFTIRRFGIQKKDTERTGVFKIKLYITWIMIIK